MYTKKSYLFTNIKAVFHARVISMYLARNTSYTWFVFKINITLSIIFPQFLQGMFAGIRQCISQYQCSRSRKRITFENALDTQTFGAMTRLKEPLFWVSSPKQRAFNPRGNAVDRSRRPRPSGIKAGHIGSRCQGVRYKTRSKRLA